MSEDYITREVEVDIEALVESMDDSMFEWFLDYISTLACGNDLLMDVVYKQIKPCILSVTGDPSEAMELESYKEEYGEETIWDMRRDEPEAFR